MGFGLKTHMPVCDYMFVGIFRTFIIRECTEDFTDSLKREWSVALENKSIHARNGQRHFFQSGRADFFFGTSHMG